MGQRYWVVGGEYADCGFKQIEPGTAKVSGPFADELKATCERLGATVAFEAIAGDRQRFPMSGDRGLAAVTMGGGGRAAGRNGCGIEWMHG